MLDIRERSGDSGTTTSPKIERANTWPFVFIYDTRFLVSAASHNWWKFDLAISYILLPSQSITLLWTAATYVYFFK